MANGVSFDDDPVYSASPTYAVPSQKKSLITGLLLKVGIATSEKEANIVLIVLIFVCVFISAIVIIAVQPHPHPLTPAQFQSDLVRMHAVEKVQSTH